jgi:hypothetical protein
MVRGGLEALLTVRDVAAQLGAALRIAPAVSMTESR